MTEVSDDVEMDELVCDGRRERLAELLAFVQRACERAALDPDVAFDVRLATEEVVTNVIEHGYAGDDPPGPIAVRFRRDPRQVVAPSTIVPGRSTPRPSAPPIPRRPSKRGESAGWDGTSSRG